MVKSTSKHSSLSKFLLSHQAIFKKICLLCMLKHKNNDHHDEEERKEGRQAHA